MRAIPHMIACPELDDLDRWSRDELDELRCRALEDHLSGCITCQRRLDEVAANLKISQTLRESWRNDADCTLPQRIGSYEILRELGRGGMGVVYLARQDYPRRLVALKVLRPGVISSSALRRFREEANLLARLDHTGIAKVYDAGVADERPYLAMEYIQGERLDHFARNHQLSTSERIELLARIADAVHHAHLHGVIHRDLKPANILVGSPLRAATSPERSSASSVPRERPLPDGRGSDCPKILDFGVARALDADGNPQTMSVERRHLLGTIPFMSPEQIEGGSDPIDARSDIYSLGVIGYLLLVDQLPYALRECSLLKAARRIREESPRRMGSIDPNFRGDLETIIAKALEKKPGQRYQSAAELAAELRRHLNDEPITARRPGTFEQWRRFTRRNRALVGGIAATILALSLGLAAAVWQTHHANHARRETQQRLDDVVAQGYYLMNDVVQQLLRTPGGEATAHRVAEDLHDFFGRIAGQYPNDRDAQEAWWASKRLLANLAIRREEHERALELMRDSHALMLPFAARFPDDLDLRFEVGYSLKYLAAAEKHFDPQAAEAHQRESMNHFAALVWDVPDSALFRRQLAAMLRRVAEAEHDQGRIEHAWRLIEEAEEHLTIADEVDPQNKAFGLGLAGLAMMQAKFANGEGDLESAIALAHSALSQLKSLSSRYDQNAMYLHSLGKCHYELAKLHQQAADPAGAIEHARHARTIYRRLHEANPQEAVTQTRLAAAEAFLAGLRNGD